MISKLTERLINLALEEDLGDHGDITSKYFIAESQQVKAKIFSKEKKEIVISGVEIAQVVFKKINPSLKVEILITDGQIAKPNQSIIEVSGDYQSILTAERTALNFLQRLSAIASLTRLYVNETKGTETKILDTRKTTPAWRELEKAAVRAGGGENHRMGLYDAVLVKDNHLEDLEHFSNLQTSIDKIKNQHHGIFIEVEVDSLEQLHEALKLVDVDRILLDNMDIETLKKAVKINSGKTSLEASGGVKLENIKAIAETGVDYISCGSITHSAQAVDLSLDVCKN